MNMNEIVLVVAKTLTLLFGGTITVLSYRAFRRTNSPSLRALTLGIGLVTAGAFVSGALHQFTAVPLDVSVSLQSVFTAVGFGILTYSLYTKEAPAR